MIAWAIQTAIAVSVLIAAVLLVRGAVAKAFGARAAYALWLAPALRAITPPLPVFHPPLPLPVVSGTADYQLITQPVGVTGFPVVGLIAGLWLAGAAIFLAFHIIRHRLFLLAALADGQPLDSPAVRCDVVASPYLEGPAATGLVHPLILVPADFTRRFTPAQQRLALLHEQLHHQRGDIWASAAALLLNALLWFNPLAHLALGAFRRDMEAACDASLLGEVGRCELVSYGETILRCAARPVPRSLCALTAIDELKGRLTMLNIHHGRARKIAGLVLAGGVSFAGLAFAAPATADEPKAEQRIETKRVTIQRGGDGKNLITDVADSDIDKIDQKCPGEVVEVAADSGDAKRKEAVKLRFCTGAGESRAEMIKGLERGLSDLQARDEMPAGVKAELVTKLRAKIDALRAGG